MRALQERLGHHFADLALLDRALTHSSRAHEGGVDGADNEPLEFLGDSLLGFIVADLLHRRDPDGKEGLKSRARAQLVSSRSLARRAAELGVPALLALGRGEEKTGGRQKAALWADAYEAVIAALYLDGGMELAQRFVAAEFARDLEAVPDLAAADPKSALQELLQGRGEALPEYLVVAEEGPSHRRRFRIRCVVGGQPLAEGEGTSKKQAQQDAARKALDQLRAAGT
ncbi:MAG TPA: ribonuclease III [Vicinamibacteria bacterium]|nr:ribonuclease III [Vicinamibacteria bacterium]